MWRIIELGAEALRVRLGIAQEDPKVFRANSLEESVAVARIIRDDEEFPREMRGVVEVGIVLDLMPDHLTPRRDALARRLGCSVKTVRRRELAWEGLDPNVRFALVHRASRLVIALRAAIM